MYRTTANNNSGYKLLTTVPKISTLKIFVTSIAASLSLSLIFLIVIFFNDLGKQRFSDIPAIVNTDLLDDLDAFFRLNAEKSEWRLTNFATRRRKDVSQPRRRADDFDCNSVETMIPTMSFLAAGWTKAVYKAEYMNMHVAVKTVDFTGQDISQCLEERQRMHGRTEFFAGGATSECYRKAARKIVKEIVLLSQLQHPNVIKIFGYCIPKEADLNNQWKVTIVTELGEPVNLIRLLQLSWEDRLRLVLSLARLLAYLSKHPMGSLVMNDMRRQQFVLVKGELKLVDVDDVGIEEPACTKDAQCFEYFKEVHNSSGQTTVNDLPLPFPPLQCINKTCNGFNAFKNVFNTARHFTTFLLPYGTPAGLEENVKFVLGTFRSHLMKPVKILKNVENLVHVYAKGDYLMNSISNLENFQKIDRSDLNASNDYPCQGSSSYTSCVMSVANLLEAESMCSLQPACKAFVWTKQKTWTGRSVVFFKNSVSTPLGNPDTVLYVKD